MGRSLTTNLRQLGRIMEDFNTKFISAPYNCDLGSSVNTRIEHTVLDKDVDLDGMLEQFQYFLLACGYPIHHSQYLMFVDESEDYDEEIEDEIEEDLTQVTRVELIDAEGRRYTNHDVKIVVLDVQDEGRTLKVFVQ